MKPTALALVALMMAAGLVATSEASSHREALPRPGSRAPGIGTPNFSSAPPVTATACWSEPSSLADIKISSEIITRFNIVSELANDFTMPDQSRVTKVIAYGGYFNWMPGDPDVASFSIKFHQDQDGVPGLPHDVFTHAGAGTFIGYDGQAFPTYKYEVPVSVDVMANQRQWLVVQATDHSFPPQWGRQGTGSVVTGLESLFKCATFGYPNWTPAGAVAGYPFDAAQELECESAASAEGATPGSSSDEAILLTPPSPNPAMDRIGYEIDVAEPGRVRVLLVDLAGRILDSLFDGELSAGIHRFTADARSLAAGTYFVRAESRFGRQSHSILVAH